MTAPLFDPAEVAVAAGEIPALARAAPDFHVEVGFGKDVRILHQAEREPEALFLGVEISRKKAASFCRKAARLALRNVRAFQGDARLVFAELLPAGSVASLTVLFPDPWAKRRHNKHRWIQADTARLAARALRPGGAVVAATDHDGYAAQIREVFLAAGLRLCEERGAVPEEDRTLFAQRFERLHETVTWMRFQKD